VPKRAVGVAKAARMYDREALVEEFEQWRRVTGHLDVTSLAERDAVMRRELSQGIALASLPARQRIAGVRR
jgi:hypothetical protein